MSTQAIVGAFAVVVIVVGGGFFFLRGSGPTSEPSVQANELKAGAYNGSITELASQKGDWKCTIDTSTLNQVSSGVVYVSDGKVRGEFTTSIQNYGAVSGEMLVLDGYVYTWSSIMPNGIKVKAAAEGDTSMQTQGQAMDASTSYSYDCQPWALDASKFALPDDVSFIEPGV